MNYDNKEKSSSNNVKKTEHSKIRINLEMEISMDYNKYNHL